MHQPPLTAIACRPRSSPQLATRMVHQRVRHSGQMDTVVAVAGICLLGLLLQEAAWVHIHYMQRIAQQTPDVLYRAMILGFPFAACALLAISRRGGVPLPGGWGLMLAACLLSTATSIVMALETCYEFKYFAGDFLRFSAPWLTLYLSYWAFATIRREQGLAGVLVWYDRLALVALLDAAIATAFGLAFFGCHISNNFFIFLIGWAILNDRYRELTTNLVLMGVLVAMVLSGKRTTLVLFAFSVVMTLFMRLLRGRNAFRTAVNLAGMALVGVGAQLIVETYTGGHSLVSIVERLSNEVTKNVLAGDTDNSYQSRLNEVENIRAYFKANPAELMFGIGFGGEIPQLYNAGEPTASGNMHHAHKGWWLYLLRNGYLGVALLAVFSWSSTWRLLWAPSEAPLVTASCAIYASCRVVAALSGNLMMEELDLPLVVGLGFALVDRHPRNTDRS